MSATAGPKFPPLPEFVETGDPVEDFNVWFEQVLVSRGWTQEELMNVTRYFAWLKAGSPKNPDAFPLELDEDGNLRNEDGYATHPDLYRRPVRRHW